MSNMIIHIVRREPGGPLIIESNLPTEEMEK